MEYRFLGKSGLRVSALSYGSWVTFHTQADENNAYELEKLEAYKVIYKALYEEWFENML